MSRSLHPRLRSVLGMLAGAALCAAGINLFFRPGAIFAGGIPGLAIVVLHWIGEEHYRQLGLILFSLQLSCLGVQRLFLPNKQVLKGILTSGIISAMVQASAGPAAQVHLTDSAVLLALGGSLLSGVGIGTILRNGYRFAGIIGLAEILAERSRLSHGWALFLLQMVILLLGAFSIGFTKAVLSAAGIAITGYTVDWMLARKRMHGAVRRRGGATGEGTVNGRTP